MMRRFLCPPTLVGAILTEVLLESNIFSGSCVALLQKPEHPVPEAVRQPTRARRQR
jgi:hypothetical protein